MGLSIGLGKSCEKQELYLFSLAMGLALATPTSGYAQTSLNVTNFGAVGDAVQFYVSCASNSPMVTVVGTNTFSSADIGKAFELFGAGPVTYGINSSGGTNGNQDLVVTLTNVVKGTNLYLNGLPQNTLTNTFATIGTDNAHSFQNAIQTAVDTGTNTTINVPNGKYLCLSQHLPALFADVGIPIYGGGWHLVGEDETNTVILGQGAWKLDNPNPVVTNVWRGFLFAIVPPITNDYAVSFENLTLDGGVEHGAISYKSVYPNPVDGLGWDTSHTAIDIRGGNGHSFSHWTMANDLVTRWRGENLKSNDASTNGNLTIVNSIFRDGNATAFNIYPSLVISNCVIDNMYQVAEYYQKYSTNTSYFVNNTITNTYNNAFTLNGGAMTNPPFFIQGNTFWITQPGPNQIDTCPGDNVYVISNKFYAIGSASNHSSGIVIGANGYQSLNNACNSNIVIAGNNFSGVSTVLQYGSGGGTNDLSPTGLNRTTGLAFCGNTIQTPANIDGNGWYDNAHFFSNNVPYSSYDSINGSNILHMGVRQYGQMLPLVETNNFYWSPITGSANSINSVSYANGSRFEAIYKYNTNELFVLTDTNAATIPAGAQIMIENTVIENGYGTTIPIYLNSAMTRGPINLPHGKTVTVNWTNGQWMGPPPPAAPTGLRLMYNSTPSSKLFASTAPECPWISTVPFPDFIKRRAEIPFSE